MQWGSDTHPAGALERLDDARLLMELSSPRCALSVYLAGLAVEAMLRSLIWLESKQFDERHDLRRMAHRIEELGLLRFGVRDEDFVRQVERVARVWVNSLRFAAEEQLARHLRSIGEARKPLIPVKYDTFAGDISDAVQK